MRSTQHIPWLLLALALPGCFVDSTMPEEVVQLTMSLDAPGTTVAGTTPASKWWDAEGVFHLDQWSKYVRVAVEHKKGYELRLLRDPYKGKGKDPCQLVHPGSWPSCTTGIGTAGEGEYGEVQVELKIKAGDDRRLKALAYLVETGRSRVLVYKEDTVKNKAGQLVKSMDLTAGAELDLRVYMTMHPAGKINANIRCKVGSGTDNYVPTKLALQDARAQVQYPFHTLIKISDYYGIEITGVPVGRPHYTVIQLKHVSDATKVKTIVVKKPSFTVNLVNDTQYVTLDIPCMY